MTKYAYLSIVTSSGAHRNFKFQITNALEHKLRNLKAGSITTFDLEKNNGGWIDPETAVGDLGEQTVTLYPNNIALLDIKIVDLTDEPH